MAEKIEVGVVIKGADKAATDISKVSDGAKDLGKSFSNTDGLVSSLEGGLNRMTNGAYSGFKKGAMGVKTFIQGLKATKTALISTGIGALVVAIGLLVVYWEDIKGLVTGVSVEQQKLLDKTVAVKNEAQLQLDITLQTTNSLKLRGQSEEDILKTKIKQTNAVIEATKNELVNIKLKKKATDEGALRNQQIAAGVLAVLLLPYTLIVAAVDLLTAGLAKLGLMEEGTSFTEDAAMWGASFLFDAEATAAEGQAVIDEMDSTILTLENTVAGYRLTQDKADKDEITKSKDKAKTKEEIEAELAAELARLRAENLTDAEAKALALLEVERVAARQALVDKGAQAELLKEFDKNYEAQRVEMVQGFQDDRDAAQKVIDDKADADKEMADAKKIQQEEELAKALQEVRGEIQASTLASIEAVLQSQENAALSGARSEEHAEQISKKFAAKKRKLAIANILLQQGQAVASAIAGAMAAGAATGVAAPLTTPLFLTQMVGLVLGGFAGIKGIMNQAGAEMPEFDDVDTGGGGGGGGGGGTQLALTPTLDSFGAGTLELPAVQAFIIQNDIADAATLQAEIQAQASL
mgnify:CR=1 FL=1|tara:strand:+ start:49 stop:1791 length:1743 start_codon:yes stop_codon:yes gene_type:complete